MNWYRRYRWDRYWIGLIEDQALANKALDLLVNLGAGGWVRCHAQPVLKDGAITLLQKCVAVPVDGILGPGTAWAVN